MDLAQTLIRSVVRAFYDTKHVLVIDALMVHSALPNEDLALLLGMQQKDLRKLCGKLREDRLLAVHARQETREGQQRAISKDYYYIDFHATIDAIKYRIFHLTEKVKNLYKPSQEKKDYHCPRCQAQWTQLEVLDRISPFGEFLCHRCNGVLERDDVSAANTAGHERQSKLHAQLDQLLQLMPQIDAQNIPKNDFETAYAHAVPIIRDEAINPIRKFEPVTTNGIPIAVKGINQAAAPIEVSLTNSAAQLAAERAEAERKATMAAQNALPVWHTASTVTGEATALGNRERERLATGTGSASLIKGEDEEKNAGVVLHDELAAYYAQMAEERAKEAQEDRDSSGEEDDEDEFEDVGIVGVGSGVATPSSSMSGAINGPKLNGVGIHVKAESESGSSAPGTNFSTPVASETVREEEEERVGSPAKRIKLDNSAENWDVKKPLLESTADMGKDSDEDEAEFEDAL